jgi:hypothetical protein
MTEEQVRNKIRKARILKAMMRDKYGNVIPCGWNQILMEELNKLQ